MKVSALIRKTAKKNDTDTLATVYFRLRDGKKDIKAASELTINPNHWSAEKQGFKDRVALVSEKEKQAFNSHVRNIVTLITQSYTNEANGEWLSETIERYHHPQRFQTEDALAEAIKLQVIPLFDEFLEKHKLSEVRKKNYRVVKRGLRTLCADNQARTKRFYALYRRRNIRHASGYMGFFRERIPILPALSGHLRCNPRSSNAATAWKEHFIGLLFADSDVLLLVQG